MEFRDARTWPADPVRDGWEYPDEWLEAGPESAGRRGRQAIAAPGHPRGHTAFGGTEWSLLFSGDHMLPHITASISPETVPLPAPLASFLDSPRLTRSVPGMRLPAAEAKPPGPGGDGQR